MRRRPHSVNERRPGICNPVCDSPATKGVAKDKIQFIMQRLDLVIGDGPTDLGPNSDTLFVYLSTPVARDPIKAR